MKVFPSHESLCPACLEIDPLRMEEKSYFNILQLVLIIKVLVLRTKNFDISLIFAKESHLSLLMEQQLVSESIIVSGYDSRDTKSSPIGTSDCSCISSI